MIEIAILGHGVVGSGVAEVLNTNREHIARKVGQEVRVKRILDLRSFPELPYAALFTTVFDDILQDEDIRIVVETMGGLHPAYDFVKACLLAGKSVITSNKELVAAKGDELLAIAKANNLNFLFEASVGGGIPIIRPLDQCLAANEVSEIAGILNGTTNFMLTRMVQDGMDFEEALRLAQSLGYAERDPSADVGGHDACRKICILASLAFGRHVYPEQVHTEGITAVTAADVACAAACGHVIKLIGRVARRGERLECQVAPMLVPVSSLLADVNDVFNAVLVRGNAVGDVVFYGRGAGKLPTASAVVADVMDAAKHLGARKALFWEAGAPDLVVDHSEYTAAYMLRLEGVTPAQLPEGWRLIDGAAEGQTAVLTTPLTEAALTQAINAIPDATLLSSLRVAEF